MAMKLIGEFYQPGLRANSLYGVGSRERSVLVIGRAAAAASSPSIMHRCYRSTLSSSYDVVIVGGGIVGTATARELGIRHPNLKFGLLDKEKTLGAHQSSHNSGVIHAGVYYTPGSLKAKLCVQGHKLIYEYCDRKKIPYKRCGKLIVAVDPPEILRLDHLYERALKNGVRDAQMVGPEKIKEIEPHCQGLKAIWSPHTGIIDFNVVNQYYAKDFTESGGTIHLDFRVKGFGLASESGTKNPGDCDIDRFPVVIKGNRKQSVRCRYVVTCGGLFSDRLAEMSGCVSDPKIVPFRGEYLLLKPEKCNLIRGNIYPVPNPNFPFLGVHFTPRMDGSVWLGPNAVLAFKREGYRFTDFSIKDFADAVRFRGFQKVVGSYAAFGAMEILRSFILSMQVKQLQKYIPELSVKDVTRGPAGVRAQAMSLDGKLVDDFVFDGGDGELGKLMLHVRNAPSPGATSSQAIAKMVANKVDEKFHL